jgi:transcriptional regulator with XRE-family HTH domain
MWLSRRSRSPACCGDCAGKARLTQEELAGAAGVSVRAFSNLERGAVTTPQKDTVRLLGDALGLIGPVRAEFEAAARDRPAAGGVAAATRTLPRDIASFTGRRRELEQRSCVRTRTRWPESASARSWTT